MLSADTPYMLILEGSLTTSRSEAVRNVILDALRDHATVAVDCSKADEIDVTFLQTLIAAGRTALDWRKDIRLAAPPPALLADALRRCGFPVPTANTTSLAELFSLPSRAHP
jgi:hypothetical protein